MADVHGLTKLRLTVTALGFTGSRANPSQNPREDVDDPVEFVGTAVAFFKKAPDIGGYVGIGRTSALAGDIHVHIIEVCRICGIIDLPDHFQPAIFTLARIMTLFLHGYSSSSR